MRNYDDIPFECFPATICGFLIVLFVIVPFSQRRNELKDRQFFDQTEFDHIICERGATEVRSTPFIRLCNLQKGPNIKILFSTRSHYTFDAVQLGDRIVKDTGMLTFKVFRQDSFMFTTTLDINNTSEPLFFNQIKYKKVE